MKLIRGIVIDHDQRIGILTSARPPAEIGQKLPFTVMVLST